MAPKYRLRLTKLQFCSLVDEPAQPNAKTLLFKRAPGGADIEATARLAKLNDELGLAFFWAFTSTNEDGTPHHDLHGDAIDQDFVKAAMEFMTDGGGAVDEMHDGEPGAGRVVFAMPMTPDIAQAFGIVSKHVGLMIAIKPTAAVLAKLKDGTYTGVSIAGLGIREAVKRVAKSALVTTETLGHQHLIDLACMDASGSGSTSWQTAEGAEYGHSHAWTRGADGTITILADGGHTHELLSGEAVIVVPADAVVVVATETGVEARAPAARKSPPAAAANSVGSMDAKDQQIATLSQRGSLLTKMLATALVLPEAHRAHAATLGADDAEVFLGKSASEREAIVKAAAEADPVVFKGATTGVEVRRSHGALAKTLAEQGEQQAATIAKQQDELAKAAAARETAEIQAIAKARIPNLAGSDDVLAYVVKSIRQGGGDATMIEAALKAVSSGSVAMADLAKAKGINPGAEPGGNAEPLAKFNAALATFAKSIGKTPVQATAEFTRTPEGSALYVAATTPASN